MTNPMHEAMARADAAMAEAHGKRPPEMAAALIRALVILRSAVPGHVPPPAWCAKHATLYPLASTDSLAAAELAIELLRDLNQQYGDMLDEIRSAIGRALAKLRARAEK